MIHAAGHLRDGLLCQKTAEQLAQLWQAKVLGTWLLDRQTRQGELDFFVG